MILHRYVPKFLLAHCRHFMSALTRCSTARELKAFKCVLITQGRSIRESLGQDFVNRCCDLGSYDLAFSSSKLFGTRTRIFLQNLMLKRLCDDGLFEEVLAYFGKFRISGCPSDHYTFPLVLKACAAVKDVSLGIAVHGVLVRKEFCENTVVQTALVGFYSRIGCVGTARKLLDGMPEPDVVAWNALISGCCSSGYDEEVLEVLSEAMAVGLRPSVSTLASMIHVCSRLGFLDAGKSLHGLAVKFGMDMDESLIPCLISMYGNCGFLLLARELFVSVNDRTLPIWNAMISATTANQKLDEAFELFLKMLRYGLQPNTVTFVSIIPACANNGSLWHGESLHGWIVKCGLVDRHSVAAVFLSMYAKSGEIKSAETIYDSMKHKDMLSWNSMVSGYVSNGLLDASFIKFREMQSAGFNPDAISVISILSSCSEVEEAFLMGKSVHSFAVKNRIDTSLNVCNALLAFYAGAGKLDSAFIIFNRMSKANIVSWNTMLSGCLHSGETETAFLLFRHMQKEDVGFDVVTLKSLLPFCNASGGRTLHGYGIKTGFDYDVSFTNALISMYLKCGDQESGTFLFENLPSRNVVSWNALLSGYLHLDTPCEITVLVRRMTEEKQKPNYITLLNLVQLCNTFFEAKAIHAYSVRTGFIQETPLFTSLMLTYARFGNAKLSRFMFELGQKHRNISMWNAVITAYLKVNDPGSSLSFFRDLLRNGDIEPDCVTCLSVISACVQTSNLVFNDSIFGFLIKTGFDRYVAINNAIIDLYSRCGNMSAAIKLFEQFPNKDTITWSVLINAYGLHGDGEAALSLLSDMRLSGMKPDDVTYLNILSACSHAGLVDHGRTVFHSMIRDGIHPTMKHYACFIDLLGRTGYLEEAYDILKSLPCEFSDSLIESLLGACLTHGNVQIGEELGKLIPGIQTGKSGLYVILHNIYASAGRWTDANRLRFEMEEKQLTKVAGVSIVESNLQ